MSKSKKVKHYLAGQRYSEVFVIDIPSSNGVKVPLATDSTCDNAGVL